MLWWCWKYTDNKARKTSALLLFKQRTQECGGGRHPPSREAIKSVQGTKGLEARGSQMTQKQRVAKATPLEVSSGNCAWHEVTTCQGAKFLKGLTCVENLLDADAMLCTWQLVDPGPDHKAFKKTDINKHFWGEKWCSKTYFREKKKARGSDEERGSRCVGYGHRVCPRKNTQIPADGI